MTTTKTHRHKPECEACEARCEQSERLLSALAVVHRSLIALAHERHAVGYDKLDAKRREIRLWMALTAFNELAPIFADMAMARAHPADALEVAIFGALKAAGLPEVVQ